MGISLFGSQVECFFKCRYEGSYGFASYREVSIYISFLSDVFVSPDTSCASLEVAKYPDDSFFFIVEGVSVEYEIQPNGIEKGFEVFSVPIKGSNGC